MLAGIRNKFHPLWRLRKLRWFRFLQKKLDFPVWIKSGKFKCRVMLLRDISLVVPSGGREDVTHSLFEKIVTRLEVSRVFDIGANVGLFSWQALNLNPSVEVHLFEPDRTNIRLLKATIRRNELNRISLWEGVVAGQVGELDFLVDEASGATGSIGVKPAEVSLQSEYGMKETAKVASTTLDEYVKRMAFASAPTLVKIDVEGAEGEVVSGGTAFFRQHRPIVIVECFFRENLDPLAAAGYKGFSLAENSNYLFVPEELVQTLSDKGILPP